MTVLFILSSVCIINSIKHTLQQNEKKRIYIGHARLYITAVSI